MAMKLGNDRVLDEITVATSRGWQAERRDMFAAAALTGLIAGQNVAREQRAGEAVYYADAMLAALDAASAPASVSVPPPMRSKVGSHFRESVPVLVTTSTGTQLIGRYMGYQDLDPVWAATDGTVIHGVVGWEPVEWRPEGASVPPAPVSRPPETRQTQRGGA